MSARSSKGRYSDTVTATIRQAIEAGTEAFEMPWHGSKDRPINAVTGAAYRGVNTIVLWVHGRGKSEEWATYRQWQSVGAQVGRRARGKGAPISVYRPISTTASSDSDGDGAPRRGFFTRYTVFNRDDVDDVPPRSPLPGAERPDRIERAERFVRDTGATVHVGGSRAYYDVVDDRVVMPDPERFRAETATEAWYSVLLHELGHWSGAPSRLDRHAFDGSYAFEELVAELAAAMLCSDLAVSLEVRPDHAAYIAGWLDLLGQHGNAFPRACTEAENACAYLHAVVNASRTATATTAEHGSSDAPVSAGA